MISLRSTPVIVILSFFFIGACSNKKGSGLAGLRGAGGGPVLNPQVLPATIEQVKVANQRQGVESLINALDLQASRVQIMTTWEALKAQLPVNGSGSEYSSAVLFANTQLVAQACSLVPATSTGLPAAPATGQPSMDDIRQIANFYSQRLINRAVTNPEISDFTALVSIAYTDYPTATPPVQLNPGQKFKRLNDMICTVIGTSAEAQLL